MVVHARRGNQQLSQELGMRRLRRHAEETGKVVAIATRSGALANRARMTGIPVARKPEHVRWDSGGRMVFRVWRWSVLVPRMGLALQVGVIGLILAGIAVAAVTIGPKATVTIAPPTVELSESLTLTAFADRDSIELDSLSVPADSVVSTQRITVAVRTTGKTSTPTKQAKVVVAITNPGPSPVTAPGGAILVTVAGDQFTLDLATLVPARSTVTQSATATKLGASGNVAAGALTRWQDAGLQGQLTVTNPQAAAAGVSEERPAVDAADIATVKALAQSIEQSESAKRTVLAGRPRDGVFLGTAKASVAFGEPSAAVGEDADFVFLEVDVTVTATAVTQATLEALAVLRLGAQAPGALVRGSVTAIEEGAALTNPQNGGIRNTFKLIARFAKGGAEPEVEAAIKGKSKADAEAAVRDLYGSAGTRVKFWPSWAPWAPRVGFRIDVELAAAPEPNLAGTATPSPSSTSATASPTPTSQRSPTPSATRRP